MASARIEPAMTSTVLAKISGSTFGRMWTPTIRRSEAPKERIRITNCRSRSESTCERTIRAVPGQPVSPMTKMIMPRL